MYIAIRAVSESQAISSGLTKVLSMFFPVFSYLLFHLFSLSWSVGWNKAAEGLSLKRRERERERERRCNHATSLRALFAASFGSRGRRSVQMTILIIILEDVRYLAINLTPRKLKLIYMFG